MSIDNRIDCRSALQSISNTVSEHPKTGIGAATAACFAISFFSGSAIPATIGAIGMGIVCIRKAAERNQFKSELDSWCNEKIGTPEHPFRIEAKEKILHCYDSSGPKLDLNIHPFDTGLTSLPRCINKLTHLKELHIRNNRIESLHGLNLPHLTTLVTTANPITNLEGVVLPNLKELSSAWNGFTNLDSFRFPKLERLNLACNSLISLALDPLRLPSLRTLNAQGNDRITTLDPSLLQMPRNFTLDVQQIDLARDPLENFRRGVDFIRSHDPAIGPEILASSNIPLPTQPAENHLDPTPPHWTQLLQSTSESGLDRTR